MAHPKGELNDRCQQHKLSKPVFSTHKSGSEHEPAFHSEVSIDGVIIGRGDGKQKRDAERNAAKEALSYLDETNNQVFSKNVDEAFEGPWPIFPEVLAASLNIANARVDNRVKGEDALSKVRAMALTLYKKTLEDLGEVVEVDE